MARELLYWSITTNASILGQAENQIHGAQEKTFGSAKDAFNDIHPLEVDVCAWSALTSVQ